MDDREDLEAHQATPQSVDPAIAAGILLMICNQQSPHFPSDISSPSRRLRFSSSLAVSRILQHFPASYLI